MCDHAHVCVCVTACVCSTTRHSAAGTRQDEQGPPPRAFCFTQLKEACRGGGGSWWHCLLPFSTCIMVSHTLLASHCLTLPSAYMLTLYAQLLTLSHSTIPHCTEVASSTSF